MWIVRNALDRPYTIIVMVLLILLATPFALLGTPTDILPEIRIPVVSVIWNYNGLPAQEVAQRIAAQSERSMSTTVNDIEHIESQSLAGTAVIKIFFQPKANLQTAIAQVVSSAQSLVRQLPTGITPPLIISYSASTIPVIQLGLTSATMSEQQLNDVANTTLRPQLITIAGAALPLPYGGKTRVVSVDLDTQAMLAKGLTPSDVVAAVNAQNLILPGGTAKLGATEYGVRLNGSPDTIAGLNAIPVRTAANGATILLSEVAHVRDGFAPQTNIVKEGGKRGVLLSVLKNGGASTLEIVDAVRSRLTDRAALLPSELTVTALFDQSVFVRAGIHGVIQEALIAAALTAAMILLFLGNWRNTVIIALSIPLSIFSSILMLHALGETINVMTLGGLALAVGVLVDDATVTIENIERHLHLGADLRSAIIDGAGEIGVPALVSTLCICVVFVPMFFLSGVARFLFVPLAEAVVFAMLASYVLSRTLVPVMVLMMTPPSGTAPAPSRLRRIHRSVDARFEQLRGAYLRALSVLLVRRRRFCLTFLAFCVASCGLFAVLGEDFFPTVDSGQIRLHMRAPSGTRIEETARLADQVDAAIRELVPQDQLATVLANLGLPASGINLSYSNAGTIAAFDGEFQISLKPGHAPSELQVARLRAALPARFPGIEFFFQPADIVGQILNFGVPAAIDVQVSGNDSVANFAFAGKLLRRMRAIPGMADVHIHQRMNQPQLSLTMDRSALQQHHLNAVNVAQNMLVSLSGSFQTSPGFWLNPANGVVYSVAVQTPQHQVDTLDALMRTPVGAAGVTPQLLGNLVSLQRSVQQASVSRYDLVPVIDVYGSVEGRDLGSVAAEVRRLIDELRPGLNRGSDVTLRGQVQTMQTSFNGLALGLAIAVVLVYLLIVVNFQSWIDPLVIMGGLPAALAGIAWMLFLSGTRLSVPALTGAIMTVGVATANSILIISFARQRLDAGVAPLAAALEAGATRLRPVLMTAMAMIIGMAPMALGVGEGSEQNAPLGRAVIGGLMFATVSTLLLVPVLFASVHRRVNHRARKKEAL
jgi:multidrug efflux pump subunit AcrB